MKRGLFVLLSFNIIFFGSLSGAILYYKFFKKEISSENKSSEVVSPEKDTNFEIIVPPKDSEKIEIKTKDKVIYINNLYKNPVKEVSLGGIIFKENNDFGAAMYPGKNGGFIITILDKDIQSARDKAEKEFVQLLGITQEDACLLTVSLGVPFYINNDVAGRNYGLSFCPNGKPFFE